jgi:hypothetical protein
MRAGAIVLALLAAAPVSGQGDVALEYRVKAAYLFNFTKFVEWPSSALPESAPLTICVAGENPFGPVLADTIRGEIVNGRQLVARVARRSDHTCHVLFVPRGVEPAPYLRTGRVAPQLTVGESADFLRQGGIINFVLEDGRVRFEINQDAAARARLRISSRLLRLARGPEPDNVAFRWGQ